jgi:uncharacterized membrane protein
VAEIIDEDELDAEDGPETEAERDDRRGVARLEAFSDGVFAIAITLLVLGIEVPDLSGEDLEGQLNDAVGSLLDSNLVAYFIGFAVIGLFWVNHHQFFGMVERSDNRLLWTNLAFLSFISLMPFSTGLIGEYGGHRIAVVVFAVNVAVAASGLILTETAAVRSRLLGPDHPYYAGPYPRWQAWATPVIFPASVPVAFLISPEAAQWTWILTLLTGITIERHAYGD